MNEKLYARLEALGAAWRAQFENPVDIPLSWSIDAAAGVLCLNGVEVCHTASLEPTGETFDVEVLTLPLIDGYVDIVLDCPYTGPGRVSEIVTHKEVPEV